MCGCPICGGFDEDPPRGEELHAPLHLRRGDHPDVRRSGARAAQSGSSLAISNHGQPSRWRTATGDHELMRLAARIVVEVPRGLAASLEATRHEGYPARSTPMNLGYDVPAGTQ